MTQGSIHQRTETLVQTGAGSGPCVSQLERQPLHPTISFFSSPPTSHHLPSAPVLPSLLGGFCLQSGAHSSGPKGQGVSDQARSGWIWYVSLCSRRIHFEPFPGDPLSSPSHFLLR